MEATSTASSVGSSVDGRSVGGGSDYLNLGMFAGGSVGGQQQQQQSRDILVGGAGGGFSLGNGFGNDSSGAGNSAPGSSFDLTDFPSLGGTASAAPSGNGLLRTQQQQQQHILHQQMLQGGSKPTSNMYRLAMGAANGNFDIASEDFPALSGAPPPPSGGAGGTNGSGLNPPLLSGAPNPASVSRSASSANPVYDNLENTSSQLDGSAGLLGGAGLGGLGSLRSVQQQSNSIQQPSALPRGHAPTPSGAGAIGSTSGSVGASSTAAGSALSGDYGLLGLLGVIRMTDADRNSLALGSDLTMLGLNLGSAEQIYSTFSSPYSEEVATKEPHYQLPMCYYMQPPALKTGHLSKFQLETLFYIFYALPKDVLQAYAAQELYSREWRYHGESKLWFKRAGPADGVANLPSGSPQYLYFDINSWERRLFNGSMNQNISSGFLAEDEVRVKFPNS